MSIHQAQVHSAARTGKGWYIASGVVLGGGGVVILLLAVLLAAIKLSDTHIEGAQYGWNAVAFVIYVVQIAVSGWGGIFAVVAAILAGIGLARGGSRAPGIVFVVLSLVLSMQLVFIPIALTNFDYYIY